MLIDFLNFEKYTEMNKEQLSGAVGCSNKLSSSFNINEGELGQETLGGEIWFRFGKDF